MTPWFEAQILQPGFSTWLIDSTAQAASDMSTTLFLQQKLRACENYHNAEPLDVTVWDADWNRYDTQISASGQTDVITIDHPGISNPVMFALNANGRLNQGRMDFTYTINDTEGIQNLPWVAMRVGCDVMPEGDSALVRIEHHWAAPDAGPVEPYVDELSTTHFWTVGGIWPAGVLLDARLQYYGNNADQLDFELYGNTEENGFLAWRPDASAAWQECLDYEWQPGSLTNGAGLFRVLNLRQGQYAFAKGDVAADVSTLEPNQTLQLWPNPVQETLNLQLEQLVESVRVTDALGRTVYRMQLTENQKTLAIPVQRLEAGLYHIVLPTGTTQSFIKN